MKVKLESSDQDEFKITMEFETINLIDIVENFENFLKGCGFIFDGLEIVEKDDGE